MFILARPCPHGRCLVSKWPERETDVAAPVVAWLIECGWEVFQEVKNGVGDRADIVARRGPVLWVIEVKRTLSLVLLAQAHGWRRYAHKVSIAFPHGRRSSARANSMRLARLDGLGLLEVRRGYQRDVDGAEIWGAVSVAEVSPPVLSRGRRAALTLVEEQKTYAKAGNAASRFWSPFRATCMAVAEVVRGAPGLGMSEVVARVDHHYASKQSARGSLLAWARAGKLEGVVVRGGAKDEGKMRLYPDDWQGPIRGRVAIKEYLAARRVGGAA